MARLFCRLVNTVEKRAVVIEMSSSRFTATVLERVNQTRNRSITVTGDYFLHSERDKHTSSELEVPAC